jgi:hypothetical protein
MFNKVVTALAKPLTAKLAWLGGSLAAITAILSVCGFLALRAHQHLLGIHTLVPAEQSAWTVEGGRFVYNSVLYLFSGLLTNGWILLCTALSIGWPLLLNNPQRVTTMQARTATRAGRWLLMGVSFTAVMTVLIVLLKHESVSDLLVVHQTYDTELVRRSHEQGLIALRSRYALLVALLVLLFVWLRSLPTLLQIGFKRPESEQPAADQTWRPTRWHLLVLGLWGLFLIPLFYLPLTYGKLAKANEYFNVCLIKDLGQPAEKPNPAPDAAACPEGAYQGWLLYKDSSEVVVYTGTPAIQPIQIFRRGDFARIQVIKHGNIFAERMTTP